MKISIKRLFKGYYKYCECGCKTLIPCINKKRKLTKFKHGHQAVGKTSELCHLWKGGRIKKGDYWYLLIHDHPNSDTRGYIAEHIYFFTQYHKCYMLPWGVVHHKDGNKENNMIWNLEGMIRSQHILLHRKGKRKDKSGRKCSSPKCKHPYNTYIDKYGYEKWRGDNNGGWLCFTCFCLKRYHLKKSKNISGFIT